MVLALVVLAFVLLVFDAFGVMFLSVDLVAGSALDALRSSGSSYRGC
jgi:hypothetical protein